jgi:prephenate dehydrogenase
MPQPFNHVVIIGCGLLGASLGLALRKKALAALITGVGRYGSPSVAIARQRGAIDRATADPAPAVRGDRLPDDDAPPPPADLVLVCTPVRQFPDMFRRIAPALAPGAIVSDVGSTKAQVLRWAAEYLPSHAPFIGSHPMAGSEKSGPTAAREDLFSHAVCLVCPPTTHAPAAAAAYDRIVALWQALEMRIIACNPNQHDRWVAAVSHLPYALAATLVNVASRDPAALDTAAGGFTDTSRIASGDITMWADILLTNRAAVLDAIRDFHARLSDLESAVERGDESAIRAFLSAARTARDAFLTRRYNRLDPTSEA